MFVDRNDQEIETRFTSREVLRLESQFFFADVVERVADDEAHEIAALMAAAPRLLAACKLIEAWRSAPGIEFARKAAVEAIKATEVSQ
jgi:hypothetical protein